MVTGFFHLTFLAEVSSPYDEMHLPGAQTAAPRCLASVLQQRMRKITKLNRAEEPRGSLEQRVDCCGHLSSSEKALHGVQRGDALCQVVLAGDSVGHLIGGSCWLPLLLTSGCS